MLWWLADDPRLGEQARHAIRDAVNEVAVSAVSVWEISIKQAAGALQAPDDLINQITENDFRPLAITVGHAHDAGRLPRHHDDPFDRMLVAQAMADGFTVVTADAQIGHYGVPVLAAS